MILTDWPVIIFPARYSGVYEGGNWIAVAAHKIPAFAHGGDLDCVRFFELNRHQLGIGDTPDASLRSLIDKVGYDRHGFLHAFDPVPQESEY